MGPPVTVNDLEQPKRCLKYSLAVSLAVMVFKEGTRMASLVRLQMV